MKNNFTISQRNAIVENHLWCVKAVMKQNRALIRAAKLDADDVYQELALRLIQAVMSYDPEKGDLGAAYLRAAPHGASENSAQQCDLAGRLPYEGRRMSLRDKMLAVMADVNASVSEREELVELIAIALLTRKNLFILGDPGQAKSYAINAFRSRITGAKQFERLLSKQTDEEQLFGRLDLSSLIPGSVPESAFEGDGVYQNLRFDLQCFLNGLPKMKNETTTFEKLAEVSSKLDAYRKAVAALHPCEPVVQTEGKIPEADIVFLDEIFKCNDGVLNALLTALNERKYTNEGRTYPIPTISFFAASNEIPNFNDPEEKILAALYDRLELKVVTENISEKSHRLAILKDKLGGSFGAVHATISLEELRTMQQEVAAIQVPDSIHDLMDDVLCALRAQIPVSDRKFLSYFSIAQAKAWLEGHTEVTSTDLLVLRNYFWQQPSDREFVTGTLERLCVNPMQEKVSDLLAMAQDAKDDFDSACGAAENVRTKQAALRKFRGELVRLYQMQTEMAANAASDSEKALTDGLLSELERISKAAHESIGFTYTPLEQLAVLQ